MITFKLIKDEHNKYKESVLVDGKVSGHILDDGDRFYYQPKGSKLRGDTFSTVFEVKRSIVED